MGNLKNPCVYRHTYVKQSVNQDFKFIVLLHCVCICIFRFNILFHYLES